jgi:hypothetical protein
MRASPKLTCETKATMRNLRYRRFLYSRRRVPSGMACKGIDLIRRLDAERAERDRETLALVADMRRAFADAIPPPPWAGLRPHLALDQMRFVIPPAA